MRPQALDPPLIKIILHDRIISLCNMDNALGNIGHSGDCGPKCKQCIQVGNFIQFHSLIELGKIMKIAFIPLYLHVILIVAQV